MASIQLNINNKAYTFELDPQMPLLWVIRDFAGLKGTKYGCGISQCGACTVHLEGTAIRSCQLPVSAVTNRKVTTIEGLSENNDHPLQKAWIREQVPQCGYCHSGQIMSAAALLRKNPHPSDQDINTAMQGNICRCGTYLRIRSAIHSAAGMMQEPSKK